MRKTEFMDLLRYYFRHSNKDDLQEILSDCEALFRKGMRQGLSEEEICRQLGSPKNIYRYYIGKPVIPEENPAISPYRQKSYGRQQNPYDEQTEPDVKGEKKHIGPIERSFYILIGIVFTLIGKVFSLLFLIAGLYTALLYKLPDYLSLLPVPTLGPESASFLTVAIFLIMCIARYIAHICRTNTKKKVKRQHGYPR